MNYLSGWLAEGVLGPNGLLIPAAEALSPLFLNNKDVEIGDIGLIRYPDETVRSLLAYSDQKYDEPPPELSLEQPWVDEEGDPDFGARIHPLPGGEWLALPESGSQMQDILAFEVVENDEENLALDIVGIADTAAEDTVGFLEGLLTDQLSWFRWPKRRSCRRRARDLECVADNCPGRCKEYVVPEGDDFISRCFCSTR